jgi:hypothetical protein
MQNHIGKKAETTSYEAIIQQHENTISGSLTVDASNNALSCGDITIDANSTVTITGNWTIV